MLTLNYRVLLSYLLLIAFITINLLHEPNVSAGIVDDVIISEVAWAGTGSSSSDEWLELYNKSCAAINVDGWILTSSDGSPTITLSGSMPPGYWLFERTDDMTVSDISADFIYSGSLTNSGETLLLKDNNGITVDSANADGGGWPAGESSQRRSMERLAPDVADSDANWSTNSGAVRNGLDAAGNPINGTPRKANEPWNVEECVSAEIAITKTGPPTAEPATAFHYTITITNSGNLTATVLTITDTLPSGLTYISDTSGVGAVQDDSKIIWTLDELAPSDNQVFKLEVAVSAGLLNATPTNIITASTSAEELDLTNNWSQHRMIVGAPVLLNAIHYSAYTDGDEAVQLINNSGEPVDISGWRISDKLTSGITFDSVTLAINAAPWVAKDQVDFERHFGFSGRFYPPRSRR